MDDSDKVLFFDKNIYKIFSSKDNNYVRFIVEVKNLKSLKRAFADWPPELKVRIVDKYLLEVSSILLK